MTQDKYRDEICVISYARNERTINVLARHMPSDKEQEILLKIGDKLKELRIKAGFTSYRKFADEYEIEPKQYWRMEEGKSDFRFTSLLRLLDIHNLTADDFLKGVNQ